MLNIQFPKKKLGFLTWILVNVKEQTNSKRKQIKKTINVYETPASYWSLKNY